jgi:DNA-binding NarL/FixJ family response regulator
MDHVPRVLVAHENALYLMGARDALLSHGYTVVADTQSVRQLMTLAARTPPDAAIVGAHFFGHSTVPEVQSLARADVKVIVVACPRRERLDREAFLEAGASAVALEALEPEELAEAVRRVLAGEGAFVVASAPSEQPDAARGLTPRELEVLQAVGRGLRNDAIARELAVTPNTVKYHLDEIYRKLRVKNRVQAMNWSISHGLVARGNHRKPERAGRG